MQEGKWKGVEDGRGEKLSSELPENCFVFVFFWRSGGKEIIELLYDGRTSRGLSREGLSKVWVRADGSAVEIQDTHICAYSLPFVYIYINYLSFWCFYPHRIIFTRELNIRTIIPTSLLSQTRS